MRSVFKYLSLVLALVMCLCIVSCAAKGDSAVGDAGSAPGKDAESSIVNDDINRKIVYTVRIGLETVDVSALVDTVSQKSSELGGYIQSRNESYSDGECTYATITYRVPTEKLDEFVGAIEGNGGVRSKNIGSEDITTKYVDAQAKKSALEERKLLLEQMLEDSTASAGDRITVINEISAVNTELQSIELLIKGYDSEVNYSTVIVTVDEKPTFIEVFSGILIFVGVQLVIVAVILIPIFAAKRRRAKKAQEQTE